jgi:predicted ATPase
VTKPVHDENGRTTHEGGPILTPDQRIRVFVSSTLEELSEERAAVRRAIEGLHLAPVLFELGARPHPPRSLYRSYLDQSHIFVGIYWQRYGWVAPGMEVSGLEDEYLLAGSKPKLIYVKRPAPEREERLSELLERVRSSDDTSYKPFTTAHELTQLVADDLALLLTEAFLITPGTEPERQNRLRLPADPQSFIGRAAEVARLRELLAQDDVRVVTLTGPGGIGKTRLALRVGNEIESSFEEGAAFVGLAGVDDPERVPAAIAAAVELRDVGTESLREALRRDLADRSLLLVIDNAEHLTGVGELVADLLETAPRLKVLVTSRAPLRIRAEHEFEVPPLEENDCLRLFAERAAATRPGFVVDEQNAETIAAICARLDHVPLAIELAAARARLLSPEALLERLDRNLDILVARAQDLPERQRTLRSTIQWSHDLLDDDERGLFATTAVFVGSFSLAAVEAVHDGTSGADVLDLLASLVEKSLVRVDPVAGEPRFRLLTMIREFAREQLDQRADVEEVRERHAEFYRQLCVDVGGGAPGPHEVALARFSSDDDGEGQNLRAALTWFLEHARLDDAAEMGWVLWVPAWVNGQLDDGQRLARAALAAPGEMTDRSRARILLISGMFNMWKGDYEETLPPLREAIAMGEALGDDNIVGWATVGAAMAVGPIEGEAAAEELAHRALDLCRRSGDRWGESAALNALGWLLVGQERFDGNESIFEDTLSASEAAGDEQFAALAEVNLAEYRLHRGDIEGAAELLASSAARHRSLRSKYSVAYLLDAAARLAFLQDDAPRSAVLLAAAEHCRSAVGVGVWGSQLERRNALVDGLRSILGPEGCEVASNEGHQLGYFDALDLAIAGE